MYSYVRTCCWRGADLRNTVAYTVNCQLLRLHAAAAAVAAADDDDEGRVCTIITLALTIPALPSMTSFPPRLLSLVLQTTAEEIND